MSGSAATPLLWSAGLGSVGDGAFKVAAPLLAASLTSDPRAVAAVSVAYSAAWLTGLLAGALTDRLPRRQVLVWSNLLRALGVAVLAVLIVAGWITVAVIAVAAFLMAAGTVFYDPAAQAVLPGIVGRKIDTLSRMNGRLTIVETAGRSFVGVPLGSATFGVGAVVPFLLNAVAYLSSVAVLRTLPVTPGPSGGRDRSLAGAVWNGLVHLVRDRTLFSMSLLVGAFNFADAVAMAVFVLFAVKILGVSELGYGLLLTCIAAGTVAGGWLAERVARARWEAIKLVGAVVQAAGWVVVVATRSAWSTGAAFFVMGVGTSVATVAIVSTRQAMVTDHMIGRVVAGFRVIGNGSTVIGGMLGGLVAARYGLPAAPWTAAGLLVLTAVPLGWLVIRRRVRADRPTANFGTTEAK
jgi:MFS family permease